MSIKIRLIIMNFLQFAVWGAYLTSMGSYLVNVGLHEHIGMFYAMQGIVSLFMPAVLGIIADRWIPAQKLLSFSHFTAALFMAAAGYERCGRGFRNPVHTLLAKRCFLYAYIGIVELRGLHRTRQSRTGYHQDIPSHTYFRHNRIHLLHVGGGPARTAK